MEYSFVEGLQIACQIFRSQPVYLYSVKLKHKCGLSNKIGFYSTQKLFYKQFQRIILYYIYTYVGIHKRCI